MAYYGGSVNGWWKTYMNVSVANNPSNVSITISFGIYYIKTHGRTVEKDRPCYIACTGQATQNFYPKNSSGDVRRNAGGTYAIGSKTYTISKKTTAQAVTLKASVRHSSSGSSLNGTSTASTTYTVPALASYAVTYNANTPSTATQTVQNMPSNQTKWYGQNLTLASNIPTLHVHSFLGWNTSADGTGTTYQPSDVYSGNGALTLYAQWLYNNPPTVDSFDDIEITSRTIEENGIAGFSGVSLSYYGAKINDEDRTFGSITMTVGNESATDIPDADGNGSFSLPITQTGELNVSVTIEDSEGASSTYNIGTVTFQAPTWTKDVVIQAPLPVLINGNAVLDEVKMYNYQTSSYDDITGIIPVTVIGENEWSFPYTFDADHVYPNNSTTPQIDVTVLYDHYDSYEKEYRKAFFSTTRNQNFSNGIYNTVFVSGVDREEYPNYTSRVWWSEINNPLYFPDLSYVEVGSNDTAVMGLTKVGSYLGAIKQSKTTDTAIYLLYPTSFEEDTTYAVKQGVQGVGAIGKYTFNILGDETLFLSPNGVMAIVPTQDEEHKVQNRSYFVDGKLLKEPSLENAYSFVHDGKYWLSVGDGKVYVLDGNQRNSWGNDKTNLVYECYYLENVPANCFVKYNDTLAFSDDNNVCSFKPEGLGDTFVDAYKDEETDVPVYAEWSTIVDDDGSLHYYKTMQKKGNLVSILPSENEQPYKEVFVDEETFNENKEMYFVLEDGEYVRCTLLYVYDPDTQYFVENRTNTKVFVKKDGNDEVEIERTFSLSSEIPSEMFLKKKFKKYKRLQFIIRNDAPEPFGIDSIIKNYTVGNYAKK